MISTLALPGDLIIVVWRSFLSISKVKIELIREFQQLIDLYTAMADGLSSAGLPGAAVAFQARYHSVVMPGRP